VQVFTGDDAVPATQNPPHHVNDIARPNKRANPDGADLSVFRPPYRHTRAVSLLSLYLSGSFDNSNVLQTRETTDEPEPGKRAMVSHTY
jgi:hypothetical protein